MSCNQEFCFPTHNRHTIVLFIISWMLPILATVFYSMVIILPNWEKTIFNVSLFVSNKTQFIVLEYLLDDTNRTNGIKIAHVNNSEKIFCLMNMRGGLWEICDVLSDKSRSNSFCNQYDKIKDSKRCFNYLYRSRDFSSETYAYESKNLYFLKMQNNVIACAIMVLICSLFAFGLALASIIWQLVLCGMVASVLFAMSALFSVFASAIQKEKVKLLQVDEQCHNYTPLNIPSEICPYYLSSSFSATTEWPFTLSLVSSVLFAGSTLLWIMITRNLRLVKTKAYL